MKKIDQELFLKKTKKAINGLFFFLRKLIEN
jgi:hypothetical protein